MKSITLTDSQAADYDNDDKSVIADLMDEHNCEAAIGDEMVLEIYHPEGFLIAQGYSK